MEEEHTRLLALFDLYWFDQTVLAPEPPLPTRRRFLGDGVAFVTSSDSALLAHHSPKLYPVLSGKAASEKEEVEEEQREVAGRIREKGREHAGGTVRRCGGRKRVETRRRMTSGAKSRSLSELEFEELKGFMDLGFDFSAAESDQRLLSIVPGLNRLGRRRASAGDGVGAEADEAESGTEESTDVPRPYLSEAWEVVDLEEERSRTFEQLLRDWKIPAAGEGVDMKGHLRCWAHAVASAVW